MIPDKLCFVMVGIACIKNINLFDFGLYRGVSYVEKVSMLHPDEE
jgi:hypothetical protein